MRFLILIILVPFFSTAQIIPHFNIGYGAKNSNFRSHQLEDDDYIGLTAPISMGLGLIAPLGESLSARGFFNYWHTRQEAFSATWANSELFEAGVEPRLRMVEFSDEQVQVLVGIPVSFVRENVQWARQFIDWKPRVRGEDQYNYTRLGFSPTLNYQPKDQAVYFELAVSYHYAFAGKSKRMISYMNLEGQEYQPPTDEITKNDVSASLRLGFRF